MAYLSTLTLVSPTLFCVFLVVLLLLIPLFFVRLWLPVWFGLGHSSALALQTDLSAKELSVLSLSLTASLLLGLWPHAFF